MLEIIGTIYLKKINKLILGEKFLTLKNKSINPEPIQYGTALEWYLKFIFQYRIIFQKIFIKGKLIKDSISKNWNFIKNKSEKYTNIILYWSNKSNRTIFWFFGY